LLAKIVLFSYFYPLEVLGDSSFNIKQVLDGYLDWTNMTTGSLVPDEYSMSLNRSTDIVAASYFSNGTILNATLSLFFPLEEQPSDIINYGILIDGDFNNETGYDGIDYQLELSWNGNKDRTWNKTLYKWLPNNERIILDIVDNYTGFSEKNKKYITLSLDLSSILYPDKYRLTFYAEERKEDLSFTDFTKTIAIPPLELSISTSPTFLVLYPGERKTIEVMLNSTEGYEPTVVLSARSNAIDAYFGTEFGELRIPTLGVATIPMTVFAPEDSIPSPNSVFITANSTFPPEQPISVKPSNLTGRLIPNPEPEDILKQSAVMVTIQEPLGDIERIAEFWSKLGDPIAFMYGIIAGASPWLYAMIKQKLKKKDHPGSDKPGYFDKSAV
jgi:hypothetical protein